jgi:hypothetical protein
MSASPSSVRMGTVYYTLAERMIAYKNGTVLNQNVPVHKIATPAHSDELNRMEKKKVVVTCDCCPYCGKCDCFDCDYPEPCACGNNGACEDDGPCSCICHRREHVRAIGKSKRGRMSPFDD